MGACGVHVCTLRPSEDPQESRQYVNSLGCVLLAVWQHHLVDLHSQTAYARPQHADIAEGVSTSCLQAVRNTAGSRPGKRSTTVSNTQLALARWMLQQTRTQSWPEPYLSEHLEHCGQLLLIDGVRQAANKDRLDLWAQGQPGGDWLRNRQQVSHKHHRLVDINTAIGMLRLAIHKHNSTVDTYTTVGLSLLAELQQCPPGLCLPPSSWVQPRLR